LTDNEPTKIQELLCELRVADVMHDGLIKIEPSVTMEELRAILRDNRISGVPVESDGELLGIISLDDFIRWISDGARDETVGDRMTTDVDTVYDSDPLVQAIKRLERMGYGRLPIINRKTGRLQGLLTKGDIIAGLLQKIDIDYRLVEAINTRSSHVFEDIVADDSRLRHRS
jgi:CBS domain-containing protein